MTKPLFTTGNYGENWTRSESIFRNFKIIIGMEVNIDNFDTFQRFKYLVLLSIFTVLIAFSGRLKFFCLILQLNSISYLFFYSRKSLLHKGDTLFFLLWYYSLHLAIACTEEWRVLNIDDCRPQVRGKR